MSSLYSAIADFDIALLRWIQVNRMEGLDGFLYGFSLLTSYISIGMILIIGFQFFKYKTHAYRTKFFTSLFILLTAGILSNLLKFLIERERPFVTYPDIIKLSEAGSSSFPSGHTTEAFAMAFGILFLFPKSKFFIPVFIWAIMVAYSRMALGVHFPLDVFGGILTGFLISYFYKLFYKKWNQPVS